MGNTTKVRQAIPNDSGNYSIGNITSRHIQERLIYINKPKKIETDNCLKLSIFSLNQKHVLRDGNDGDISWSFPNGNKSYVHFHIFWDIGVYYIQLVYTAIDLERNRKQINYDIELTTTPCNFGGKRFWFLCSGFSEGKVCGKRVAVLYKPSFGEYFSCRHCYNLTYESSNLSGRKKKLGKFATLPELEELRDGIKKPLYKGDFTKRFKRYLKKSEQTKRAMHSDFAWLRKFIKKSRKRPNGLAYKSHEHQANPVYGTVNYWNKNYERI